MARILTTVGLRLAVSAVFTAAVANCQPYSISGTVTNVANNGPVEAAAVTISGSASGTVLTNAAGQYSFTNLAQGSYVVQFGPSLKFRSNNLGGFFNTLGGNHILDFPVQPQPWTTLMLQNDNSNAVSIWLLNNNGQNLAHSPIVFTAAADWKVLASGDFNQDRVPDLVLQNSATNQLSIWYMGGSNGTTLLAAPALYTSAANWQLVSAGDMNDDGIADLLFQNAVTNALSIWYMGGVNGATLQSAPIVATPLENWRVVGTADFDGNGAEDIIFQNTVNNGVSIWYRALGSAFTVLSAPIIHTTAPNWRVVGASYVNGDTVPDMVLQNSATNQVSVWLMGGQNGATVVTTPYLQTPLAGWRVKTAE
jgi:hypothetical protein